MVFYRECPKSAIRCVCHLSTNYECTSYTYILDESGIYTIQPPWGKKMTPLPRRNIRNTYPTMIYISRRGTMTHHRYALPLHQLGRSPVTKRGVRESNQSLNRYIRHHWPWYSHTRYSLSCRIWELKTPPRMSRGIRSIWAWRLSQVTPYPCLCTRTQGGTRWSPHWNTQGKSRESPETVWTIEVERVYDRASWQTHCTIFIRSDAALFSRNKSRRIQQCAPRRAPPQI